MFWNKKFKGSKDILHRLEQQEEKNINFQSEIEKLKVHINSLRGLVNRKLGYSDDQDNDDPKNPEDKKKSNKTNSDQPNPFGNVLLPEPFAHPIGSDLKQ